MLLDPNYKSSCKFAEDVIAYLYGEINNSEKLRFEQHLSNCDSCVDELAGFTSVRSLVLEWRNQDFTPLETPEIIIPYKTNSELSEIPPVVEIQHTFSSKLRSLFNFSPKLLSFSTGFAVIAICLGLTFIIFNSFPTQEVAGDLKNGISTKINSNTLVEPSNTTTSQTIDNLDDSKINETKIDVKEKNPTQVKTEMVVPTKISVNSPQKQIKSKSPKSVSSDINKVLPATQAKSNTKSRRPSLTDEEDDDDSLRLADLFDDSSL